MIATQGVIVMAKLRGRLINTDLGCFNVTWSLESGSLSHDTSEGKWTGTIDLADNALSELVRSGEGCEACETTWLLETTAGGSQSARIKITGLAEHASPEGHLVAMFEQVPW
jgi:hypothetical protein